MQIGPKMATLQEKKPKSAFPCGVGQGCTRENEKMKRTWGENEEMEREWRDFETTLGHFGDNFEATWTQL